MPAAKDFPPSLRGRSWDDARDTLDSWLTRLATRLDQQEGRSGTPKFFANIDANGKRITNGPATSSITSSSEFITKAYADATYGPATIRVALQVSGSHPLQVTDLPGGTFIASATTNKVARFISPTQIGDSNITDDGTDITANLASGRFHFTGGIAPTLTQGSIVSNWTNDGTRAIFGTTSAHELALRTDGTKALWISTGQKVGIAATPDATTASKLQMFANTTVMRTADATALGTLRLSNAFLFQGAYWDGAASQTVFWDIRMEPLTTTPTYKLFINNNAGTEVLNLRETGDLTIIGDLIWKSGTSFTGTFAHAIAANRIWTFPDVAGTVVTTGNLTAITATGTITSGTWQGTTIAIANGGTNATSYTSARILYYDGTSFLSSNIAHGTDTSLTSGSFKVDTDGQGYKLGTTESFAFSAGTQLNGYVNSVERWRLDTTNSSTAVAMHVYFNGALVQVEVGAVDSGGTNYRLLRVLN